MDMVFRTFINVGVALISLNSVALAVCSSGPVQVSVPGTNFVGDSGLELGKEGVVFKDSSGSNTAMNFKNGQWCYESQIGEDTSLEPEPYYGKEQCLPSGTKFNLKADKKVLGTATIESDGTLRISNVSAKEASSEITISPNKKGGYDLHNNPCDNAFFTGCKGTSVTWDGPPRAQYPKSGTSNSKVSMDSGGDADFVSVSQCGQITKNSDKIDKSNLYTAPPNATSTDNSDDDTWRLPPVLPPSKVR
jgi:hypothetical protein